MPEFLARIALALLARRRASGDKFGDDGALGESLGRREPASGAMWAGGLVRLVGLYWGALD